MHLIKVCRMLGEHQINKKGFDGVAVFLGVMGAPAARRVPGGDPGECSGFSPGFFPSPWHLFSPRLSPR